MPWAGAGGVQGDFRARLVVSKGAAQTPATSTQLSHLGPLEASRLWGSSEQGEEATCTQTCQVPLTFMNCSIDLDAKELERKRVLGSSGRTGCVFAGVGWGLDPVHPTHSKWRYDSFGLKNQGEPKMSTLVMAQRPRVV